MTANVTLNVVSGSTIPASISYSTSYEITKFSSITLQMEDGFSLETEISEPVPEDMKKWISEITYRHFLPKELSHY